MTNKDNQAGERTRKTLKGKVQYRVGGRWMPLGWQPGMKIPAPRPNEREHIIAEKTAEIEQSDDEIVNDHRSDAE